MQATTPNGISYCLLPLVVNPPVKKAHSFDLHVAAMMYDARHRNITIPSDATDVPHGFYVVEGQEELLAFFKGNNVHEALREAQAREARPRRHAVHGGVLTPGESVESVIPPVQSGRVDSAMEALNLGQPSRLEGGRRAVRGELASLAQGIIQTDQNSLVPLSLESGLLRMHRLYIVELMLEPDHHPHHVGITYQLPIDTCAKDTWLYGKGFGKFKIAGGDPKPWPSFDLTSTTSVGGRNFVMPPSDKPWDVKRAPVPPNEWSVRFADDSAVYLRYFPDHGITTNFPCWHWEDNRPSRSALKLPCVLAYAANSRSVSFPYDGNLGLSVPRAPDDMTEKSPHILDAFEENKHVAHSRTFLIKLNHPDKWVACGKTGAISFLFFGALDLVWPCPLKPTFTPEIPLSVNSKDEYDWCPRVVSMKFFVVKHEQAAEDGQAGQTYELCDQFAFRFCQPAPEPSGTHSESQPTACESESQPKPKPEPSKWEIITDSAAAVDPRVDGAYVGIDSGSSHSHLPQCIIKRISEVWLKNDQRFLGHNGGAPMLPVSSYCGTERNLDECEIEFIFAGRNGTLVPFRCSAKSFLKSPHALASMPNAPPGSFHTLLTPCVDTAKSGWVFGANFFYSAFVWHSAPDLNKTTGSVERPFIRLAPQRAMQSDGTVGSAEHFVPFPDLPPRFYHVPQES